MTSFRHDVLIGPAAGQQPIQAAGQPPGSREHQSVPTESGRAGGMHVTTGHDGTSATVRINGVLTEASTQRLATTLNAVAWGDGERATIHLAGASSVRAGLLRVLRTARTRLQVLLTVTADLPEARFPLAVVGFGDVVWPEHHDRGGGASQVRQALWHPGAAHAGARTRPLGTSQVTARARWGAMRLSERAQRELAEVEAGLGRADPGYVHRCGAIIRQIALTVAEPPRPARGWRHVLHPSRHRER